MSPIERASRELDSMRVNAQEGEIMSEVERKALEYLNDLIRGGRGYSDALWLAYQEFKSVDVLLLEKLYAEQP